jgi:hypothetical protein
MCQVVNGSKNGPSIHRRNKRPDPAKGYTLDRKGPDMHRGRGCCPLGVLTGQPVFSHCGEVHWLAVNGSVDLLRAKVSSLWSIYLEGTAFQREIEMSYTAHAGRSFLLKAE